MKVDKKDLEKSQVELLVELTLDEFKPYIEKGAAKIAKDVKIEGFRPGKVPFDVLKQKIGEMTILEEAGHLAINGTLDEAIKKNIDEKRPAIGQPQINITKLAPDNPFAYKAVVSLLPEITMGKYKELGLKAEEAKVEDKDVEKALEDLREMRATEKVVDREVKKGDQVKVDINMSLDKVPLEESGGKDLPVMIGKDYFVPGFDAKLMGAKKGETKEFELEYPADHHQKNLAGKKVEFKVTIKEVTERQLAKLDDKFAEMFQIKSLEELKKGIRENLGAEKMKQAEGRNEGMMLEKIVDDTKFSDIPQDIIDAESRNMMTELEQSVTRQGGKFEDYLGHLKKTKEELIKEMAPNALKRVKVALIIKEIASEEKIKPEQKEIDAKVEELK